MTKIGNELVLYVAKTPTGFKVEHRDGIGLADGLFSKGHTRYFYSETAKEDAISYAESKAEKFDEYRVETAHNVQEKA